MTESLFTKPIYLCPPHMSGNEQKFIKAAFDSNYIAPLGPQLDAFEQEFAQAVGIPYALGVSSGTAALHLALRIIGVGLGDTVIASTLTFIGSINPIIYQGGMPLFIDSNRDTWNMDPDLLEEALRLCCKRGRLPKVVLPTDIYGQCADLDRIFEICAPFEIPVLADSAEALGSTYKGRSAGDGAAAAVFSFNGNKIITTSGGGMLVSRQKEIINHARHLSQQARDDAPHYEHSQIGYNYRMSNILAAIGQAQLQVLDQRVEAKRKIYAYYQKALADVPGIEFMPEAPHVKSNRWLTVILISKDQFGSDRDTVRSALEAENIESRPVWKPMHLQAVFDGCECIGGSVAQDLFSRGLCLPSGTAMSRKDLDRIISAILKCRNQTGPETC